jgi:hypothetical protein
MHIVKFVIIRRILQDFMQKRLITRTSFSQVSDYQIDLWYDCGILAQIQNPIQQP